MPHLQILVPGRGHLRHGLPSCRPAQHHGDHLRLAPHPEQPECPQARFFCLGLTLIEGPTVPGRVLLVLEPVQDCVALDLWSSQATSVSWILCCQTRGSLRLASLQRMLGY